MTILKSPEKAIMISVSLLIALGLIFIFSVSGPYSQHKELSSWYYFLRQLVWAVIALAVLLICSRLNYRNFLKLSPYLLMLSLLFLIMVLFTPAQMNVKRWLGFGFFRFQPSELFKISLLMYLAYILVDDKDKSKNLKKMISHMVIAGMGILLIIKQPDLGTTMLIFASTIAVLFLAGLNLRYLIFAGLGIIMLGES